MRFISLAIIALISMLSVSAAAADDSKNVRKISVTGKAETTLEAQRATIQLEIKHVKQEMSQSHSALLQTLSKLKEDLKTIGISDKDIKKSLILQGPEYSWEKNSQVLKGYYSECHVEVDVNDISKMAGLYRVLAGYKAITIGYTDFKRNDEFEVRKAEFEKALVAARKKAEFMAQALGAKLGKVYSIQEVGPESWFESKRYANVMADKPSNDTDTGGYGTIKISARVLVEFELE